MLTYHGNPDLKCALIRRAQMHREADRLMQSFGYMREIEDAVDSQSWDTPIGEFRGCAIGCLSTPVNVSKDQLIATFGTTSIDDDLCMKVLNRDFGLPGELVECAEMIFEHLSSVEEASRWPEQFAAAIPVGIEHREVQRCIDNVDMGPTTYEEDRDSIIAALKALAPEQKQPVCAEPRVLETVEGAIQRTNPARGLYAVPPRRRLHRGDRRKATAQVGQARPAR